MGNRMGRRTEQMGWKAMGYERRWRMVQDRQEWDMTEDRRGYDERWDGIRVTWA